jgi:hypothetical protein
VQKAFSRKHAIVSRFFCVPFKLAAKIPAKILIVMPTIQQLIRRIMIVLSFHKGNTTAHSTFSQIAG